MPAFRRTVSAATKQRIRATLRSALTSACKQQKITYNVARYVELAPGQRPRALVWTDERVERWTRTGQRPSPVMVWTPEQLGVFLDHAQSDRLYGLFHLIAFRGLRRGEACGVHWTEVDLHAMTLSVLWQIVQFGWDTAMTQPKTPYSLRTVALDENTNGVLKAHKARQNEDRLGLGGDWVDTGLVFTKPDGQALHPAEVTERFQALAAEAGLPPIRLHDLRHGAATLALAAGADMKVVQEMLGHSSSTLTRDTYTTVVEEAKHQAAATLAGLFTLPGTNPRTAAAD